jgi:hypothetical protein
MPAHAGQYSEALRLNIGVTEYWIIRWSLSSGGAPAPTRWRMMTAKRDQRQPSLSPAA